MRARVPPVSASYEELIDASAEEIFDAWTMSDELKGWFGPGGFQTIEADIEARPGGRYRLVMRAPDGNHLRSRLHIERSFDHRVWSTRGCGPTLRIRRWS